MVPALEPSLLHPVSSAGQGVDDPALGDRMLAAGHHSLEFIAQSGEVGDAAFDFGQVPGGELVGIAAGMVGMLGQTQQGPDGVDGKAEIAAPADEPQAPDMTVIVLPIAGGGAARLGQQADLLVITDGFHGDARAFAQQTDGNAGSCHGP